MRQAMIMTQFMIYLAPVVALSHALWDNWMPHITIAKCISIAFEEQSENSPPWLSGAFWYCRGNAESCAIHLSRAPGALLIRGTRARSAQHAYLPQKSSAGGASRPDFAPLRRVLTSWRSLSVVCGRSCENIKQPKLSLRCAPLVATRTPDRHWVSR